MNKEEKKNDQLFFIGMLVSMFLWGMSWTTGKILTRYGGIPEITLIRFQVTFVSLFILLCFTKIKLTLKSKSLPSLIISSVLMSCYFYCFFKGLSHGKAGAGGVLVTTLNPLIAFSLALALKRKMPEKLELLGLGIGVVAGMLLLKVWNTSINIFEGGNIYFLLAAFSWSVLSFFTAKSSQYGSPVAFSLWMYGICSLLMSFFISWDHVYNILSGSDILFWFNLFVSATITTSIATTFFFVATSRLGASKASSFIFLVPFSAAIGSWIFLDETIEMNTVAGGLLGIAAVLIINKKISP